MRIGLMSDTHGNWEAVDYIAARAKRVDLWLHMGDCTPDAEYLKSLVDIPVYGVCGNCDWASDTFPEERILDIEGHRIFLTHGHNYSVRYSPDLLFDAARLQNADIVIYGHTHVAEFLLDDGIYAINPGSASRPRDEDRPSFMLVDLEKDNPPEPHLIRMKLYE
ncbi:MAG: metallophosphoesterase [Selenomonadaceae bacterium]|nr:metallophosphoesterase [Selenomonadaceae bacterium]